jgi:predicted DNA-binding transcriptional regulator AlpA
MDIKTQQNDPLLNDQQAAARLDVMPETLQHWRSTRRYPLDYVKIGRNVRYRTSVIDAFIESRTVHLGEPA